MATLTLSNKILEKYVSLLKGLDPESKRKIINKLTESLDTKEEKVDVRTLFGAWEDNRTSDEIINDIKDSRIEKEFDSVKTFRAIKEKISLEMEGMSFDQIKEYLKTYSAKLYEK